LFPECRTTSHSAAIVGKGRFSATTIIQGYLQLMAQWCGEWQVEIWCYCLMPNQVHLIAVPAPENALRQAIGEAHRRYTRRINFRERRPHTGRGPLARGYNDRADQWGKDR
jgi:REP element-mobilizing transposase RayT